MNNETDVKEAEVTNEAPADAKTVEQVVIIQGTVTITLNPDGSLQLNAPGNHLLALAILKAGEVFLTMQMHDQMKKAQTAIPPRIMRPNGGDFSKFKS